MKLQDLKGRRFGKLLVISRFPKQAGRTAQWVCKCDCGKQTIVQAGNLRSGCTKSCGNHHYLDLTNRQFGRLTVVSRAKDRIYPSSSQINWLCQCSCGNQKIVLSQQLTSKKTRSCGCLQKQLTKERHFTGYQTISGRYWSSVKKGAKRRNLKFSITIEDVWNLYIKQDKKCAMSGVDIIFSLEKGLSTASIDRKNNKLGYTLNNIQIVHKRINIMKNNMDILEFLNWCQKVCKQKGNNKDAKSRATKLFSR